MTDLAPFLIIGLGVINLIIAFGYLVFSESKSTSFHAVLGWAIAVLFEFGYYFIKS